MTTSNLTHGPSRGRSFKVGVKRGLWNESWCQMRFEPSMLLQLTVSRHPQPGETLLWMEGGIIKIKITSSCYWQCHSVGRREKRLGFEAGL